MKYKICVKKKGDVWRDVVLAPQNGTADKVLPLRFEDIGKANGAVGWMNRDGQLLNAEIIATPENWVAPE